MGEWLRTSFNSATESLSRTFIQQKEPGIKPQQYELRSYLWRSLATFFGPLFVLALYAFICAYYFQHPPSNGIVSSNAVDARLLFYGWFITAVVALDWGRTGLANVEAAALMRPKIAPRTAAQLMWHVDANWSNLLWWVKCFWFTTYCSIRWRKHSQHTGAGMRPIPNRLWIVLSFTSALLFISISMSGLSMELRDVKVYSNSRARIFGPNSTNFNAIALDDVPQKINVNWQSGRKTSPQEGAIFYAPEGTPDTSLTYFDDQAAQNAKSIEVFTGPAVHEDVVGTAWGISANISCRPTAAEQLQMIRVRGIDRYEIRGCASQFSDNSSDVEECHLGWLYTHDAATLRAWPAWLNETAYSYPANSMLNSMIAVADGASGVVRSHNVSFFGSQYTNRNSHDNWTFNSLLSETPASERTTATFEVYLWQSFYTMNDTLDLPTGPGTNYQPTGSIRIQGMTYYYGSIGSGLHCDINTAVGFAALDPIQRTFSHFEVFRTGSSDGGEVPAMQVLALGALSSNQGEAAIVRPLRPFVHQYYTFSALPIIDSIQKALNNRPLDVPFMGGSLTYLTLTPENLQQAMYKLFGETLVAMMSDSPLGHWYGDLYSLDKTSYLVEGAVSWLPVLLVLALWTLIMCSGALWLLFFAGPRWAPSLSGFEMFKFGAQYQDEINDFENVGFQQCTGSLSRIPGMVGVLSGEGNGRLDQDLGFIGLSENEVAKNGTQTSGVKFTLDKRAAAKTRPVC